MLVNIPKHTLQYNNMTLPLVMYVSVFLMVYSCCRREEARRYLQQRDIATGHARQCVRDGVQLLQAWRGETQGTTTWHYHWSCPSVCFWWCTVAAGVKRLRDIVTGHARQCVCDGVQAWSCEMCTVGALCFVLLSFVWCVMLTVQDAEAAKQHHELMEKQKVSWLLCVSLHSVVCSDMSYVSLLWTDDGLC